MMKKNPFLLRVLALSLALTLLCACALAEPRYPDKTADATDAALLLSADTLSDWNELASRVKSATGVRLYLATVDFLDGASLADYGAGLRTKWGLDDNSLLLLLAAGEDTFGLFGGSNVNKKFAPSAQEKLLSTTLQTAFIAQDYDGALASFGPALARELGKCYGKTISVSGLFGQAAASATVSTSDWLERQSAARATTASQTNVVIRDRIVREDQSSGVSFGKVILTVFLLMVIFGGDRRRHGEGCGCSGCGCAPFSSLLAGLGLWKLWGGDRPWPPRRGPRGPRW